MKIYKNIAAIIRQNACILIDSMSVFESGDYSQPLTLLGSHSRAAIAGTVALGWAR